MPKLSLEFAVDFGSLTKELEKAESKSKEAFSNIGEGAAVGAITSAFRDIAEQIESMSGASDKFNKTWSAGLKTDEKRLSIAKEILKTQQQMADLEKHERQSQEAQGRGPGGGGGAGALGGRRGGAMNRGFNRAQGIIGQGFGLLNQASGGFSTTSDYLSFGGSMATTAGKAAGAAAGLSAVTGMGSKLLGPIGVGLYAVGEGLKFAAKLTKTQEQHDVRAYTAYQGGGEGAYNQYQLAQTFEYGRGRRDTPGGSYGLRKYGITPDQAAGFFAGMGRASGGAATDVTIHDLSALHRQYGASQEAMGLMGVTQRAGGFAPGAGGGSRKARQSYLFAKAMGVAMATEMSHGRIGESFEQIGNVASELSKRGDVNMDMVMGMVTAIGRMGDRYQGTGVGAGQAMGVLGGLAQSKTTYGRSQAYLRIQRENPQLNAYGIQAKLDTQGAKDYKKVARDVKAEAANHLAATAGTEADKWNITGMLAQFYGVDPQNMRAFHDILWEMVMDDAKLVSPVAGRKAIREAPSEGIGALRGMGGAAEWKTDAYDFTLSQREAEPTTSKQSEYTRQQREVERKARAAEWAREVAKPWMESTFSGGAADAGGGTATTAPRGTDIMSIRQQNEAYDAHTTHGGAGEFGDLRYNKIITDAEGEQRYVASATPRKHKGRDAYAPTSGWSPGNGIFAAVHGRVVSVKKVSERMGWEVRIRKEDGTMVRYLHLDGVLVKRRDVVFPHTKIATGRWKMKKTKKHVHVEAKVGGKLVDPSAHVPYGQLYNPTGVGKPEDMDPMEGGGDGSSGDVSGGDAGGHEHGDLGTDPTGLGVPASGAPAASGAVSVNVTITDRTAGGVSVAQASHNHKNKAMQPAPGDIPALYNREGA